MLTKDNLPELRLFPLTAAVADGGHLNIGGCDVVDLAAEYGTPVYLFDEYTLRYRCREFRIEFTRCYPNTMVVYASKAFLNRSLAALISDEGLGLDVVSGGEMSVARSVDFPPDLVYFHGNNKTADELGMALDWGVRRIVVDNFDELDLLGRLARDRGVCQHILLRLTPGVDPHTHRYTTTGTVSSKFGFPLANGQAEMAVARAMSASNLALMGFHFHLGSPVEDVGPYQLATDIVLHFAREMGVKHGFHLEEFSCGGGFAVQYTLDSPMPTVADYAEAIAAKLVAVSDELGLAYPQLIVEPGRGIVGQAGVALYSVGTVKDIPGVRKYVCVDGGMGDNIRPALYEARYEALVASKIGEAGSEKVTIAGRCCESGDILVNEVVLASVSAGDVIAIPVSGAYAIPMASNYNLVPRLAILMVSDGGARLIRRRETYQDLMSLDVG